MCVLNYRISVHVLCSSIITANSSTYLLPCVKVVVVGFFSPSATVCKELVTSENPKNFIQGNSMAMLEYLIKVFSSVGTVILDLTGYKGDFSSDANYNYMYNCDLVCQNRACAKIHNKLTPEFSP